MRLHESGGGAPGDAGSHKGASAPRPPVYDTPRFDSIARCLGTVPVVTVASGSVAGLPASRFVAAHFAVMVRDACVLTAGPKVVARALGYEVTKEELGGSEAHETSGVPDNFAESEADAFLQVCRCAGRAVDHRAPPPPPPFRVPAAVVSVTTSGKPRRVARPTKSRSQSSG